MLNFNPETSIFYFKASWVSGYSQKVCKMLRIFNDFERKTFKGMNCGSKLEKKNLNKDKIFLVIDFLYHKIFFYFQMEALW